jgi:N-acetylglucosamine transport system permease protein
MRKKVEIKNLLFKILVRVILIISSAMVVLPLLWNIITSFKSNTEIMGNPWTLPKSLHFENYVNAIVKANMGAYALNSIFVTLLSLVILAFLSVCSSYAIARFRFKLNKPVKITFMTGIFVQSVYIMIPLYLLMTALHMNDNRVCISMVYAITQLPFSIFLLTGFFKSIPKDFEDAAMIDGCGYTRTMFSIVAPLAKPGIITVLIFGFFSFWNEYPLALVLLSTDAKKTLPIGLQNLMEVQKFATDWGALFAGLVIVLVPTIVIYTLCQKQLTQGMQVGGIKG